MKGGFSVHATEKFIRDYKRLPSDIQQEVEACIKDLTQDPVPSSRRPHSVSPKGLKPAIFTLDVTSNKAYKLSFQISGNVATLRRVASHKQIDRAPT